MKSVDFSDPYFKQQQAILIRAEDDALYNKPEDLSGHKVGVQNGTIQVPIANELVSEENVVGLVKAQDRHHGSSRAASSMLCTSTTPQLLHSPRRTMT